MVTRHLKKHLKRIRLHSHPTVNALLFAIIFFAIAAALILGAKPKLMPQADLTPVAITNSNGGKIVFYAEVADNETERISGLSDREKIAENQGMFFVFENEAVAGFWMVKMKFPIDMIFFDKNMIIVDMYENVQPCKDASDCTVYYSKAPVMYVLEINAGLAKKNNIRIGDKGEY